MQKIIGKYTQASIMTDSCEDEAYKQVLAVCDQDIFKGARIVIMPDVHAGAGSVVGFTMPLGNFVIPNIIGVDIGCGVDGYKLGKMEIDSTDFKRFDDFIRRHIPSGFNIHKICNMEKSSDLYKKVDDTIKRLKFKNEERFYNSIGTLGGGNHFIELGKTDEGEVYLFIHSGSRNFGLQIATAYQNKAKKYIDDEKIDHVKKGLEYLLIDSVDGQNYLKDMATAQIYAKENRDKMAEKLIKFFNPTLVNKIQTTHNYINFDDLIIRKGAIAAYQGQELVIPLNMRDGVIIGRGKGNSAWNYSAPHGAGRILSRTNAKRILNLEAFKKSMQGIWSSCINQDTLDEAPMAYKPKHEIMKMLGETVEIIELVKPLYNFKAVE